MTLKNFIGGAWTAPPAAGTPPCTILRAGADGAFQFFGPEQQLLRRHAVQGIAGVMFYTRQKCVLSRWDKSYVRAMGW